jgi:hypothetical protein
MMRTTIALCTLALCAGCSAEAPGSADEAPSPAGHEAPKKNAEPQAERIAAAAPPDAGLGIDATADGAAANDGAAEAASPDAGALPEAGADGAGDGGSADAAPSSDAAPMEAGTLDAAVDAAQADASDSGPDAGPACPNGAYRCNEYKREWCTGGAWNWVMGDQSCCFTTGRYTNYAGATAYDTTTGRTWKRSSAPCDPGWRLPTTAELMGIVIGPPINNIAVCNPTVDHNVFVGVAAGDHLTSDGCVDLLRGVSKAQCGNAFYRLCVQ